MKRKQPKIKNNASSQNGKTSERILKKRAKRLQKEAPSKSAQAVLRYEGLYKSGVMVLEEGLYSKTIQLEDINYQIAHEEEQQQLVLRLAQLLNSEDSQTHLQYTLVSRKTSEEEWAQALSCQKTGDTLDSYREELDQMVFSKVLEGENRFVKDKYLTFSVKANTPTQAKQFLHRTEVTLLNYFASMGAQTHVLSGEQRVALLHELLRPNELSHFSYEDLKVSGLSTHSFVCPSHFHFRSREVKGSKSVFEMGDHFGEVLSLRTYPSDLSDRFLADLMDIPEEITISIQIQPHDQSESLQNTRSKRAGFVSEASDFRASMNRKGIDYCPLPTQLEEKLEAADDLLKSMRENSQKLYSVAFFVFAHEKTLEKLKDVVNQIQTVGRKNGVGFASLNYQQELALNSALPFGKNFVNCERMLTTNNTAMFVPFTAMDLRHADGKFYGMNELTKNAILVNRKSLNTPSGFILGSSGSGKSITTKFEILTTLLKNPNDEVIIVDPQNEYSIIGEEFGAQIVKVSPDTNTYLNLLDIPRDLADINDDPVSIKIDFLQSVFSTWIGRGRGLTPAQESIIDRVTRLTYDRYPLEKGQAPTLKEWHKILKEQPEEEVKEISLSMESFIEGNSSLFAHLTNVNLDHRFIIYNTEKLGNKLKTAGMMVVLDQIWNRVAYNQKRGITTWIYFDEIQLYLSNDYCSLYCFELWSRIRKYGGIPTGITQNVETLLLDENGSRMLSNTEFVVLLKQSAQDLQSLMSLLDISAEEARFLQSPEKGAGLIRAGKTIVPFSNTIPSETKFYQLMSTNADERYQFSTQSMG